MKSPHLHFPFLKLLLNGRSLQTLTKWSNHFYTQVNWESSFIKDFNLLIVSVSSFCPLQLQSEDKASCCSGYFQSHTPVQGIKHQEVTFGQLKCWSSACPKHPQPLGHTWQSIYHPITHQKWSAGVAGMMKLNVDDREMNTATQTLLTWYRTPLC